MDKQPLMTAAQFLNKEALEDESLMNEDGFIHWDKVVQLMKDFYSYKAVNEIRGTIIHQGCEDPIPKAYGSHPDVFIDEANPSHANWDELRELMEKKRLIFPRPSVSKDERLNRRLTLPRHIAKPDPFSHIPDMLYKRKLLPYIFNPLTGANRCGSSIILEADTEKECLPFPVSTYSPAEPGTAVFVSPDGKSAVKIINIGEAPIEYQAIVDFGPRVIFVAKTKERISYIIGLLKEGLAKLDPQISESGGIMEITILQNELRRQYVIEYLDKFFIANRLGRNRVYKIRNFTSGESMEIDL